jgi:hypothetical protein
MIVRPMAIRRIFQNDLSSIPLRQSGFKSDPKSELSVKDD